MLLNGYHIHFIIIYVLRYRFLHFCQKNDKIQQNIEIVFNVVNKNK